MKDLVEWLPFMKVASSNDTFPLYAQYLYSDGEYITTCNNSSYIKVRYPLEFKGYVNVFVLHKTLSTLKGMDGDFEYKVLDDKIKFKHSYFKSELSIIEDLGMPSMELDDDVSYMKVDDEILNALNIAKTFVGKDVMSPIFVDSRGIIATDTRRLFSYSRDLFIDNKMSLNSNIISLLSDEGFEIGVNKSKNTVVKFDEGFAAFTVESLDFYPDETVRSLIKTIMNDVDGELCNVLFLRECAENISPIFYGEDEKYFLIRNAGKTLSVEGRSGLNGVSEMTIDSKLDSTFEMRIESSFFNKIPIDYDVYKLNDDNEKLLLYNDTGGKIVLMGAR